MHVLLIGSGGREHAIAAALRRSPRLTRLSVAPGNAGIAAIADIVALDPADHAAVIAWCRQSAVDFVVIGPEAPLVAGIVDDLAAAETAIGLAILVVLFRSRHTIDVQDLERLKG